MGSPNDYQGYDDSAQKYAHVRDTIVDQVNYSGISTADKEGFLAQLRGSPQYGTSLDSYYEGIVEALKNKQVFADDIARQYKESIARAGKVQSTLITKGTPAFTPQGSSSSLITSGTIS